jgi:hypothetical protein
MYVDGYPGVVLCSTQTPRWRNRDSGRRVSVKIIYFFIMLFFVHAIWDLNKPTAPTSAGSYGFCFILVDLNAVDPT